MKPLLPLLFLFGARAYAQSGEELFLKGQYAEAIAAFERLPAAGRSAATVNQIGMSYHFLGKFQEAQSEYDQAIKADGSLAAPRNNLGALFYSQRKFADADREFRRAADRDADNPVLGENLHRAHYARDNTRDARDSADQAGASRQLLLEAGAPTGQFLGVISLIPAARAQEAFSHLNRADIFQARKMYEDAVIEYKRAFAIDRYDAGIVNRMGIAYHNLHKYREAEQQYREALRLRPNQADYMNNLAVVDYLRGDFQAALSRYQAVLKLKPDAVTALRNMGACLFAMERWEEGIAAYQRALALRPDLFEPQAGGAGASIQMSQRNTAIMNFYLAKVFALRGDTDLVISYLLKAVDLGFNDLKMLQDEAAFKRYATDERFLRVVKTIEDSLAVGTPRG